MGLVFRNWANSIRLLKKSIWGGFFQYLTTYSGLLFANMCILLTKTNLNAYSLNLFIHVQSSNFFFNLRIEQPPLKIRQGINIFLMLSDHTFFTTMLACCRF